jgi:hypothetical protein
MRRLLVLAPLLLGACGSTAATSNGVGGATAMAAGGDGGQTPVGTSGANPGGGAVSIAGTANSSGNGAAPAVTEDAPSTPVTFSPSTAVILNPERGFYATANLVTAPDLSKLRASGVTLVHTYVRLDDYRTSDIPSALLQQASAGFEQARQAGVKIILRFAYNFGPYLNQRPRRPKLARSRPKDLAQISRGRDPKTSPKSRAVATQKTSPKSRAVATQRPRQRGSPSGVRK